MPNVPSPARPFYDPLNDSAETRSLRAWEDDGGRPACDDEELDDPEDDGDDHPLTQ